METAKLSVQDRSTTFSKNASSSQTILGTPKPSLKNSIGPAVGLLWDWVQNSDQVGELQGR